MLSHQMTLWLMRGAELEPSLEVSPHVNSSQHRHGGLGPSHCGLHGGASDDGECESQFAMIWRQTPPVF